MVRVPPGAPAAQFELLAIYRNRASPLPGASRPQSPRLHPSLSATPPALGSPLVLNPKARHEATRLSDCRVGRGEGGRGGASNPKWCVGSPCRAPARLWRTVSDNLPALTTCGGPAPVAQKVSVPLPPVHEPRQRQDAALTAGEDCWHAESLERIPEAFQGHGSSDANSRRTHLDEAAFSSRRGRRRGRLCSGANAVPRRLAHSHGVYHPVGAVAARHRPSLVQSPDGPRRLVCLGRHLQAVNTRPSTVQVSALIPVQRVQSRLFPPADCQCQQSLLSRPHSSPLPSPTNPDRFHLV